MISRSTQAWEIIRNAIVSGRLKPGTPLKTSELQELCGMSVSPVREALARLVATGLATAEHNLGYRVAPLSGPDLQDLVDTRIREESWALMRSIENGDEVWGGSSPAFTFSSACRGKTQKTRAYTTNSGKAGIPIFTTH